MLATVPEGRSLAEKKGGTKPPVPLTGAFVVAAKVRRVFSQKGRERRRRCKQERVVGKDKGK